METEQRVSCPWCAEQIMPTAIICPHCKQTTGFVEVPRPEPKASNGYGTLAVGLLVVVVIIVVIYFSLVSNYGV